MKGSLWKDSIREIKKTWKRFLSILIIVLLGVGFFAGIKATGPDMKKTLDHYFDQQNVMDIQVLSTMGLTKEDANSIAMIEGVTMAVPSYSFDATIQTEESEYVMKIAALQQEMNQVELIQGRLPEGKQECVVEESFLMASKYQIGDSIEIKTNQIGEEDPLQEKKVVIVGTVKSPLYISRARGSSKLGSGKIDYYMFVPQENVSLTVYTELYITVEKAKELLCYGTSYEELIKQVKEKIEEIAKERKQVRYDELIQTATEELQEAENTYYIKKEEAEKELAEAQEKIEQAKEEIETNEKKIKQNEITANQNLKKAEEQIEQGKNEIKSQKGQWKETKKEAIQKLEETKEQLRVLEGIQKQYKELQKGKEIIELGIGNIEEKLKELEQDPISNQEQIKKKKEEKQKQEKQLQEVENGILKLESELMQKGITLSNLSQVINQIQKEITKGEKDLAEAEKKITSAEKELNNQETKLSKAKKETKEQLTSAKEKVEEGKQEIAEKKDELIKAQKEAEDEFGKAEKELMEAKEKIEDIAHPEWYLLDRNANQGYVEYMQDTDRIDNIAKVFPVVFFVVAALISLTSMSRMVEEQRVQIGTLKALGYSKIQIAMKYILYALLATISGALIGMTIGFQLLPKIIAHIYGMMYAVPEVSCEFNIEYAITGAVAALACTCGATIYTAIKDLRLEPAKLMLPKAPKAGKRIFLERITFIWSKMKFTQKVTARNVFRYKKRFLMTIIGVCGCTSLIIAGFGLRDAISDMIPSQYGEIFRYQMNVAIKEECTSEQIEEEKNKLLTQEKISSILPVYMKNIEITNKKNNQDIQLIVPDNREEIKEFITLRNRKNHKETYDLTENKVIITEKIAKLLELKVGDILVIKNKDGIEKEVTIGAITENYLSHYMYMSQELYCNLYGEAYRPNTMYVKTEEMSQEEENKLSVNFLKEDAYVSSVTFTSGTKNIFSDVMDNMGLVVWILIVSAGLLAFVVLYNLSNVNISERIRELATIKVLGFYDKEVYEYVTKETVLLTVIGIIFGLVGGYFLTMFIIKTCELDILMFDQRIHGLSFLYGAIITLFFAIIVNIVTYHALKKIDMIDSLKSVE